MDEFNLSYREVIPDQNVSEPWKEIILNTGGTQSILQDIKFVDIANGFVYKDSAKYYTRNRFIYWRISNDVLELFEHSLDINLIENRVRYRFVDTPILNGVSIHETSTSVVVLVPTVCSVHRLIFPHPSKFHKSDDLLGIYPDLSSPSIFSEANELDARNPDSYYIYTGPSFANSQLPYLACSTLSPDEEEALFILVYPSGEILLVQQLCQGHNSCSELKSDSIVPRFLSGIADKLRSKTNDRDIVVSLILHKVKSETYLICLTRDGHLKFWSCSRIQCLAVINLLAEIGESFHNLVQGGQNHILQKAVDSCDDDCLLSVFLSFANHSGFYIFKPFFDNGHIKIIRLNYNLDAPEEDLVDFKMTLNRIWSVWRSHDGDSKIYTACIRRKGCGTSSLWMPVILEYPPENTPPQIEGESDPSQVYLHYIFQPGRFPLHIINKALNIFKRSTVQTEVNLTPALLKQRISMAIHNEIQKELKETEVSDEDYLECANWCWQRFYSCCEQYHLAGLKPLGILLLPGVSGAVFLKKSMFSFFRPLDPIEHMLLCSEYMNEEQFLQAPGLFEDPEIISDVMKLMEVIVYLNSQMSEVFSFIFEKELFQLRSPDVVMEELFSKILTEMDTEFTVQFSKMLSQCKNLYGAVHKLLELVRDAHNDFDNDIGKGDESLLHLFSSQLGVSVITQCLNQIARTRFTICRNLLLICNALSQQKEYPADVMEAIRSVCTPDIVVITQASYAVLWLSDLTSLPVFSNEVLQKRLAPLKLSPVFKLRNTTSSLVSVLELFVGSTGGYIGHKKFSNSVIYLNKSSIHHWHNSLLPYLSQLFHIIWPLSKEPILAEWLLSSGQHIWLQQYVRLLSNWCEWNDCTRFFLLACALLLTSENYKAMELFKSASKGVLTDSFMMEKILRHCDEDQPSKLYVHYYLKVIQLFELNNADDYAIQIANTALSNNVVSADDPLSATLYSIKFKNHLKLKHYSQAFDSLNLNPDVNRRYDNLRDLVKCLLDERRLDILIEFNYGNLEETFCEIILSRARAVDCIDNIFYDFLYSFYIRKGSAYFRLAGSAMYEEAFRLMYNQNIDALEKQVKCYLACINILRLIDPKNAWVVRPKEYEEQEDIVLPVHIASKGESCIIPLGKEIDAVDIHEIQKEYQFACARLKLGRYNPSIYENLAVTTAGELVVALISSGLYRVALDVCKTFDLSPEPVFEAITAQCILLTEDENPECNNWEWLLKNDTPDLLMVNNCAADVAWLFLKKLLEEFELPGLTTLHKVVVKKIIQMAAFIPHWIIASYKLCNAPELLQLLHYSGRIDEAVDIARSFMLAILGHGKDHFGIKESLTATSNVVYCPVAAISDLIIELELQIKENNEQSLKKDHEVLMELYEKYLETVCRISNDMCKYKISVND